MQGQAEQRAGGGVVAAGPDRIRGGQQGEIGHGLGEAGERLAHRFGGGEASGFGGRLRQGGGACGPARVCWNALEAAWRRRRLSQARRAPGP